mgnify:CR=1 FL=1
MLPLLLLGLGLGLGAVGSTGLGLSGFTENTTHLVYGSATLVAREQQSPFATLPITSILSLHGRVEIWDLFSLFVGMLFWRVVNMTGKNNTF